MGTHKFAKFRLGEDELADIALKSKTPLAVLVALGGVGDADARGGGEPFTHSVAMVYQATHCTHPSFRKIHSRKKGLVNLYSSWKK